MEYRLLGNTGLNVSVIGMGCEGFAEENYRMTGKMFDAAEELGINYFDLYAADPKVRKAVGEALAGRREKFIIQAHLCSIWENGQYVRTRNLEKVKKHFKELMDLLGTRYLDVGMIHYCDSEKDWDDIVKNGILNYARELKEKGVIRHIGLSSHNPLVAEKAILEGGIEVLMFAVNPCYDLQPASDDVEDLWADETYVETYVNMDPDRQRLYELCEERGVGVTVMKAFGGGDLLNAELSPAGVALSVNQCIHYALSRPGVAVVLAGAHDTDQLRASAHYCNSSEEERDYARAFSTFPRVSWEGHCMYCSHCAPCPKHIDVATVTKYFNLAETKEEIPETVREHYRSLDHHAGECIACGACQKRCPFHVPIIENMEKAARRFGF